MNDLTLSLLFIIKNKITLFGDLKCISKVGSKLKFKNLILVCPY